MFHGKNLALFKVPMFSPVKFEYPTVISLINLFVIPYVVQELLTAFHTSSSAVVPATASMESIFMMTSNLSFTSHISISN
jgi:hypothetical protein